MLYTRNKLVMRIEVPHHQLRYNFEQNVIKPMRRGLQVHAELPPPPPQYQQHRI